MRTGFFAIALVSSALLPLAAACSGSTETGSMEGGTDSPATMDAHPGPDSAADSSEEYASLDTGADTKPADAGGDATSEGAPLDGAAEGLTDASSDAHLESGGDAHHDASGDATTDTGVATDTGTGDAPGAETGPAMCPPMQPLNGSACKLPPTLTCDYGMLPKAGAICTCEMKMWHCLFV